MTILYYLFIAIIAAAMLYGAWIAAGRDGEKEGIVKYNNMEDENK